MNFSKPVSINHIVPVALVLLLAFGMLVPKVNGQANVTGKWSTLSYPMPINPVHVALLANGDILVIAGSGNCPPSQFGCPSGAPYGPSNGSGALLLNPVTGTITQFSISWDMFCNGMVLLPDGRAFVIGGTIVYDPFHGQPLTSIFDPATNIFTNGPSMAHGRWYPTGLTLGDGRIFTFSGLDENGATNNTVELYTVNSGWSQEYTTNWSPDLYPRLHLLPNGQVFYSGSIPASALFDLSTGTWIQDIANTNYCCVRTYGTSVLLPLTPANNYDPRVIIMGGNTPATKTTEIIDMGASNPAWVYGPNMSEARIEMNAVILPSGKVLAVGGSVNDEDTGSLSLNADLYDPGSNTFSSAGANATERLYHSNALLLPDATVWLAGGNPGRGVYNNTIEIYQPAYLFNPDGSLATRPSIASAPSSITYGNNFSVTTPDAANISSVVLVRNGTVTHAFGMDQRMVGMSFTAGAGSLTVASPPNGNIAPPGYYMLFVLNSSGVPSQASFVQLGQQPDFDISASPSGQTVVAGSNTSYTVDVTALGGFNGTVGLSVAGLPTGATGKFNPTTITGTGTSTLTVTTASSTPVGQSSLTITGNSGALSHQTAVTLTVIAPGAPTVTGVSPNGGPISGGTAIMISGTNFVSGATATLGGTAATNVVVVNSTTITATTAAHAAGAVTVTVTNPDTQSGSLTNGYTYTSSGGGISFVQVSSGPSTIQSSNSLVSVTYGKAQTAGDLNIVVVGWGDNTSTISSVTDSLGNTYSRAVGPTSTSGLQQSIYYAKNIAGGSNTVTVTFNQAAAYPDVRILEYSGLSTSSPLDVTAAAVGSGSSASSGSATTTSGNELIFGAGTSDNSFSGAGSGFTKRIINLYGNIAEDEVVSSMGGYAATATNSSGGWVMQMATFKAAGSLPAPTVSSVSPNTGPAAGGTGVTITGTNFVSGATATLGGTAATNVVVVNSTTITATTAAHAAGVVTVTVTNPDTQSGSLTNGYTYLGTAPTVTGVSPNNGPAAGGTAITISGTNFVSGATATLGGTAATNVVVVNSTTITATAAAHAAGAVTVTVTNPDTQSGSLTNGYTYNPAPTVTRVSPNSGTAAGGTAVTITGTNFVSGATATLGGTAATNVVVVNSTTITAMTAAHAAGVVTVTVTNPDTQSGSLTNGYTYLGTAPTVTGVSPNNGPAAGGTAITISGTNFVSGATATLGGTAATNVVVVNSTTITATAAAHAAGAVTVTVTNPDTQSGSLTNGYTYNPAPTVTRVSPNSGPAAGGTAVTITGTNFVSGATATLGGTAATNVVVVNSTTITATTAAHAAGAVTVTVTNPDTQSGSLTNGYTYTSSGGGISFVQVSSGPSTIQSSNSLVSVTYGKAQTAGDLNIVVVGWGDNTSTISSVTDSLGNTYSRAVGPTSTSGLQQSIYYAKNIAGGSNTVTVTFNQAAAYPDVRILEYSGLSTSSPLDVTAAAVGSGSSASSGSATTTSGNELIFGAGTSDNSFSGAGSGFTKRIINLYGNIAEDEVVSSMGGYAATATNSSGGWVMQMATFK